MTMKTVKLALAAAAVLGAGAAAAQEQNVDAAVAAALQAAEETVSQVNAATQKLPEPVAEKLVQAEAAKTPDVTQAELQADAGVQAVIQLQEHSPVPVAVSESVKEQKKPATASQKVKDILIANGIFDKNGQDPKKDKRNIQIVSQSFACPNDPATDKKFLVKRDMLAKFVLLSMKSAIAGSIGSTYSAAEQARIFGSDTNLTINIKSDSESVAKWPLFGVTVLAQAEVWDGKNYTIALAAVWSETLHKAAKAALLGKESKAKIGQYTVGEWLASRDLSLVCGPRQMVDKDGNRVFLGIAAREIGINAARDTVNREAAKSSAESYLVFSLFSDVEQRIAHNAAAHFAELDTDASEEIDRRMSQKVEKRVISGSREIANYELEHPITHKQMYVSVYSMDQTSIAKASVMAEELIATRVLTEPANKYALGKLQGYNDAVDAGTFEGENTLHTYCAGHLAHGEALLDAMTSDFDDNAAILLYALLVAFDNFVSYGDGVTSLEGRMNLACSKCFFSNFN